MARKLKLILTKEEELELKSIFQNYYETHKDVENSDEIILFKHPTDEIYDVTVYSCSDVAYNFIRIPTEYYCGEKVYPRTIKDISDYSYYEKLCTREIIKHYNTDLKDKIIKYICETIEK